MPCSVRLSMCMYTLIILAFMVNTDPVITQNWFFNGSDEGVIVYDDLDTCVADLTEQSYVQGVYDVTYDVHAKTVNHILTVKVLSQSM